MKGYLCDLIPKKQDYGQQLLDRGCAQAFLSRQFYSAILKKKPEPLSRMENAGSHREDTTVNRSEGPCCSLLPAWEAVRLLTNGTGSYCCLRGP